MNISVIFTGGTIGSSVSGDFIGTDTQAPFRLLSMYEQAEKAAGHGDSLPHFDTKSPYTLLSENLTGQDLNCLIACLSDILNGASKEAYDGIIVTHGTDTLQYTAAALAIVFQDANIPIVLVSSNYILDDPRANGLTNFSHAVDFIRGAASNIQKGVFVSYCNAGDKPRIYPADSLLSHAAYDDRLVGLPPALSETGAVAQFLRRTYSSTDRDSDISGTCLPEVLSMDVPTGTCLPETQNSDALPVFSDPCPVLYIKAMPGQVYPTLQGHTKAVLLETYHSGTLCTAGSSLSDFVREAKQKNIPVYVTGMEHRIAYESTRSFSDLGLQILPPCSPIYAYMLLWLMTSR